MRALAGVLFSVAAAAAIGFSLNKFGNRALRSWAASAAALALCGGVGYSLNLPSWLMLIGFLALPILLHRKARTRLADAAGTVAEVAVPGTQFLLSKVPNSAGSVVGEWKAAEEVPGQSGGEPLSLALEFVGETEDEFAVILRARMAKALPGLLFFRGADSGVQVPEPLRDLDPVTGLPGQAADMAIFSLPAAYAFNLLDIRTLSAVGEIMTLNTEQRDVSVKISGAQMSVESNGVYDAEELRLLLGNAGVVFDKVRRTAAREGEL